MNPQDYQTESKVLDINVKSGLSFSILNSKSSVNVHSGVNLSSPSFSANIKRKFGEIELSKDGKQPFDIAFIPNLDRINTTLRLYPLSNGNFTISAKNQFYKIPFAFDYESKNSNFNIVITPTMKIGPFFNAYTFQMSNLELSVSDKIDFRNFRYHLQISSLNSIFNAIFVSFKNFSAGLSGTLSLKKPYLIDNSLFFSVFSPTAYATTKYTIYPAPCYEFHIQKGINTTFKHIKSSLAGSVVYEDGKPLVLKGGVQFTTKKGTNLKYSINQKLGMAIALETRKFKGFVAKFGASTETISFDKDILQPKFSFEMIYEKK